MVLCDIDKTTIDDIVEWKRHLPDEKSIEPHHGDWRPRLRGRLPRVAACIVSFDPYMVIGENPASPSPGQMYLRDLVRAAAAMLEIQCGPLVVQLSTYKAQNNSQDKIKPIVEWIMAAVGLELVDTVRVDGNMMSMILARDLQRIP